MAVVKLQCPECDTIFKPVKPVEGGKKVVCPKCKTPFLAPDDDDDEEPEKEERVTARKPAPKKSQNIVAADDVEEEAERPAKKKPKPEAKKPAKAEAKKEEEPLETYGMAKEPEEEEEDDDPRGKKGKKKKKKIEIDYAPDLSTKDPRGKATQMLTLPSNLMICVSAVNLLMTTVIVCAFWWPALFTKYGSMWDPGDARLKYERENPPKDKKPKKPDDDDIPTPEVKWEDLKPEEQAMFNAHLEEEWIDRIIWSIVGATSYAFWGCTAYGAVKMQNLESYNWGMAAAILSLVGAGYSVASGLALCIFTIWIPVVCLAAGVSALINLRKPEVMEAFTYNPDDH